MCWLKLSKTCLNIDEDRYLGAIYVPPLGFRFHIQNETDMFEVEISSMRVSHRRYCLVILTVILTLEPKQKRNFLSLMTFSQIISASTTHCNNSIIFLRC